MNLTTPASVQKLQTALHAKAKESPSFRFYALYDKVHRKDVLAFAYECCKANGGAAGVDGQRCGMRTPAMCQHLTLASQLLLTVVGVEKLGPRTRFPSGEFLPIRVFSFGSDCLRACHRCLRSPVEEPHQSFQVLCHRS